MAVPVARETVGSRSPSNGPIAALRKRRYCPLPVSFPTHTRAALDALRRADLLRQPRLVSSDQGPHIMVDGKPVLSMCSNNYLGLANHPRIAEAARAALAEHGFGSAASRHISGTHTLHRQAEAALAAFTRSEAALLFSTGYAANTGTIQALVGRDDVVFSDALNHASLIDGCTLSRAKTHVYRHRDLDHLESLLSAQCVTGNAALVVTDAAFSMDGDLAPLRELRSLCDRHGAGLLVDEAHTLGLLGPAGRGLCQQFGIVPDVLIGTLGKAFGTAGAFAAADTTTVRLIENRARSYVFSTAPSPSLAAAALAATALVEAGDALRAQALENAAQMRAGLAKLNIEALPGELPILPVLTGDPARTMEISASLLEAGVFVHGIRPPTVPEGSSRLRVTTTAGHSPADVATALDAFKSIADLCHV